MKKSCCIILALFLLIMVPVRGYAVSAPLVFGIGEEIILPFLLSLLGVQAKESIDSYDDLVTYNDEIETELTSLAGSEAVMYFVQRAAQGLIDTDSIVWDKLYEYAVNNYIASTESGTNVDHSSGIGSFEFTMYQNTLLTAMVSVANGSFSKIYSDAFVNLGNRLYVFASANNVPYHVDNYYNNELSSTYYPTSVGSYTYNNLTVYYAQHQFSGTMNPDTVVYDGSKPYKWLEKISWLMVYGGYEAAATGDAVYSDAFSNVLSSEDKESLVDGSNVIQLYNPSAYQNGLNMIEGGDGEDDPNLKKIPAILTADWWNFLQQFGQGENDNQYVNAYNALNAIDGGSVGNVSDAYDSLGLASVISDAVNAAFGKMSLEDLNIYPDSLSVAQTIDDSIPPSLTPAAPNEGINNESEQGLYKLPDLRDYFPFCIPFDLVDLLSCFIAEPETPSFVIALSDGDNMVEGEMDLHIWDNIASVIRTFELIGFTVGLILITRNIIRG